MDVPSPWSASLSLASLGFLSPAGMRSTIDFFRLRCLRHSKRLTAIRARTPAAMPPTMAPIGGDEFKEEEEVEEAAATAELVALAAVLDRLS